MSVNGSFDLSPSQQIVWLHERLSPGSRAYNFTAYVTFRGALDTAALRAALARVLLHHPGLRLELVETEDGRPAQRISESCEPRYTVDDISDESDVEAAFEEILAEESKKASFDTHQAPLVRWRLVQLSRDEHRLIHVEHHLIHDGRSFLILIRDLVLAYQGCELPKATSYADHVAQLPSERDLSDGLRFWEHQLSDAALGVPLSGLTRPGGVRRNRGAQFMQVFDAELAGGIRALATRSGSTLYTTMLALFAELMRRHSGQDELVLGSAVANRPAEHMNSVGMFINTIPLRLRLSPRLSLEELLAEATETLICALPHQNVPIQRITAAVGRHTSGVENPLFNVAFSAVDDDLPDLDTAGLDIALTEGLNSGTTRFDLDLVLRPDSRRVVGPRSGPVEMEIQWDYDADLFDESIIELLAGRYLDLVRAAVQADLRTPIGALAAHEWDNAPTAPKVSWSLGGRPDDMAVVTASERLNYAEMDRRVERLAGILRRAGVTAGQPVALLLPRGLDCVIGLLACLRAGAVYCPLSPADPPERRRRLLDRLTPALVLTTLAQGRGPLPTVFVDGAQDDVQVVARDVAAVEGAAYVMHTSGSTGSPKAVIVSRDALFRQTAAIADRYGLTADDRVLLFTQPHFDVSLEEILPTLGAGGCLVLAPDGVPSGQDLIRVVASEKVSVVNLPTSYVLAVEDELIAALREGRWSPRLIVMGGERLRVDAVDQLLTATSATVLNGYGVTEATITSTVHELDARSGAAGSTVPLGQDVDTVITHILDRDRRPLPDGAVGELAIAGSTLSDGYLGDETTTAARFIRLEHVGGGQRVYLTGDRGYRDLSGTLHFLGRIDDQIKFRGYRIEPDEIKSVLLDHPAVVDAHVALINGEAEGQLVAYVQADTDARELRSFLGSHLSAHMIPSSFVLTDALPRTGTGKVDRAALPVHRRPVDESGPALSEHEKRIAAIWGEVLGLQRVGRDDNFFDLGGHSLLLLRVHSRLVREFGWEVALMTLFRFPTVAALAGHLAGSTDAGVDSLAGTARLPGRDRLSTVRRRRAGLGRRQREHEEDK
ncbi:amino acid adenylation domain-containing protein [Nonomuraea sp. NPDC049400]|uniref:amino acid adenylation domain-containing protein n=1 Tax=Nonomuraea sp. NPDC049400 TaxID=3364352 RepID=UPI0037A8498E